jgi:hypothetical protein
VFTALDVFVFFPDEREIKFNSDERERERKREQITNEEFSIHMIFVPVRSKFQSAASRSIPLKNRNTNQRINKWKCNLMTAHPTGQGGRGDGGFYILPFMTHVK